MKYGYARVSTDGQSVAARVDQLTKAGAEKVFKEKVSGAITHRLQLQRVLEALDEGDVLLVTRLDSLHLQPPGTMTADSIRAAMLTFRRRVIHDVRYSSLASSASPNGD